MKFVKTAAVLALMQMAITLFIVFAEASKCDRKTVPSALCSVI